MDNEAEILAALDFEPEDKEAIELADLIEANSVLITDVPLRVVKAVKNMVTLEAIVNAIFGEGAVSDERIAFQIDIETMFGARVAELKARVQRHMKDGGADD